jgi:sugar/nucleoside kinase (ribokinase family)
MGDIYVSGSIATDHLMTFPGRFADQLVADRLDTVSLSFLVDDLVVRRGGVAANIAYGMAALGRRPRLVGAVGHDFGDYRAILESSGRRAGWPFVADPSQQIARMSGDEIREFISGARYLMTNEYEFDLLLGKCGLGEAEVLELAGTIVTSRGARGVRIRDRHGETEVPAAPIPAVVDPTGGGDAFRAGFVTGIAWGLSQAGAAAIGCQLAWFALQQEGGQEYTFTPEQFCAELARHYEAIRPDAVSAAALRLAPQDALKS